MLGVDKAAGPDKKELPIGVFDSGVGGISVLRRLLKVLPCERFDYVGDEANAPYGTKSPEMIRELTLRQVEQMRQRGIKALVVACNTATSAAIASLREMYQDMPIVGIEPAVKPAARSAEHPAVLVMATPGTVKGRKLQDLIDQFSGSAEITALGCPGLMEFVERGELSGENLRAYLTDLFAPWLPGVNGGVCPVDAIVLGCTHYPFVKKAIREVMGEKPEIIDGSLGCAMQMRRLLMQWDLLHDECEPDADDWTRVDWHMTMPGRQALLRQLLSEEDV